MKLWRHFGVILELVGIPGAGKSTVENLLRPKLRARGVTVLSRKELERKYICARLRVEKLPVIVSEILRGSLYFWIAAVFLIKCLRARELSSLGSLSAIRAGYWLRKDLILSAWFCSRAGRQDQTEIYCPGEGILQHLASFRVFGGRTESITEEWLDSSIPRHSCAVSFNIPVRKGFERFWSRGVPRSWPSGTKDRPVAFEYYLAFEKEIELVTKEFLGGGGNVVVLDTECELADLEARVDKISEIASSLCSSQ